MAKKYLSIEEAAAMLGVEPVELTRMREKGDIRAFADRGTWKFRQDDVEELARNRQTDSGADIPMLPTSSKTPAKAPPKDDLAGTIMFDDDDSTINLGSEADDKTLSEQPTIVRKSQDDLTSSDSDVRLVFDDNLMPDSNADVPMLDPGQSDSDVRLIPPAKKKPLEDSDSDVKLVPDSAAKKTPVKGGTGSDSDVALVGGDDGIDLDLQQSDGSFVLGGEPSGISLEAGGSGPLGAEDSGITGADSGIALDTPRDSGIALEFDSGDSGITLDEGGDSGISLDVGTGSGVLMSGDSGISLADPSDSGIALDAAPKKTPTPGQRKAPAAKKPADDDDLGGTLPMLNIPELGGNDDLGATQMEVPLLTEQDSDYELNTGRDVAATDDDIPVAPPPPKRGQKSIAEVDDGDETSEFTSDAFEDEDGEMEVSSDVVGEDDEIEDLDDEDDVFDAGEGDFDEELQSGQSHADFALPSSARAAGPVEVEWGGGTFFMLAVGSAVMLVTSFLMYELVRTMWGGNDPSQGTETILASLRGMFG